VKVAILLILGPDFHIDADNAWFVFLIYIFSTLRQAALFNSMIVLIFLTLVTGVVLPLAKGVICFCFCLKIISLPYPINIVLLIVEGLFLALAIDLVFALVILIPQHVLAPILVAISFILQLAIVFTIILVVVVIVAVVILVTLLPNFMMVRLNFINTLFYLNYMKNFMNTLIM
jgi:hypothetical protein